MKKALVVGGGFGGCAAAHQLSLRGGWNIDLVEAASFLGGGCKTFYQGGHPYTFGPRHFLTDMEHTFEYLNSIIPMRSCNEHRFWTYVEQDQEFYHYPIHMEEIKNMPDADKISNEMKLAQGPKGAKNLEEYWIRSVGETLYGKFIDEYNKKMWMVESNEQIDYNVENWSPKGPNIKEGVMSAFDDCISAYPIAYNGYDDFFDVATKDVNVLLNTRIDDFDIENKSIWINGEKKYYDVIISTAPVDELFNKCYGELKFIGRDFYPIIMPVESVFPEDVYFCYYANSQPVTRVVEYKKLTQYKSPYSIIGVEIPSLRNRLYPVPFNSEMEKASRYMDEIPDGVFSIGRNGKYDYVLDIDDSIDDAMKVCKQL